MKNNRSATIGIMILSIVIVLVLVVSLLNACVPAAPAPIPTTMNTEAILSTATITDTPDPCARENIQATIVEFDKVSREFSDVFVLAQNTPAAQLSPTISDMQKIRRSAEDVQVPLCLAALKEYQLDFMNTAIDVSLLLYSSFSVDPSKTLTQEQINNIVAQVNQRMNQASDYSKKYTIEMARLLGVTLTPSPTAPEPTGTPATGVATSTP